MEILCFPSINWSLILKYSWYISIFKKFFLYEQFFYRFNCTLWLKKKYLFILLRLLNWNFLIYFFINSPKIECLKNLLHYTWFIWFCDWFQHSLIFIIIHFSFLFRSNSKYLTSYLIESLIDIFVLFCRSLKKTCI
jgi:hypothetical protein